MSPKNSKTAPAERGHELSIVGKLKSLVKRSRAGIRTSSTRERSCSLEDGSQGQQRQKHAHGMLTPTELLDVLTKPDNPAPEHRTDAASGPGKTASPRGVHEIVFPGDTAAVLNARFQVLNASRSQARVVSIPRRHSRGSKGSKEDGFQNLGVASSKHQLSVPRPRTNNNVRDMSNMIDRATTTSRLSALPPSRPGPSGFQPCPGYVEHLRNAASMAATNQRRARNRLAAPIVPARHSSRFSTESQSRLGQQSRPRPRPRPKQPRRHIPVSSGSSVHVPASSGHPSQPAYCPRPRPLPPPSELNRPHYTSPQGESHLAKLRKLLCLPAYFPTGELILNLAVSNTRGDKKWSAVRRDLARYDPDLVRDMNALDWTGLLEREGRVMIPDRPQGRNVPIESGDCGESRPGSAPFKADPRVVLLGRGRKRVRGKPRWTRPGKSPLSQVWED